jgi:hypothetical protein
MAEWRKEQFEAAEALRQAAQSGDGERVRSLLEAGAPVNASRDGLDTPLHEAANAAVAELLLDWGANITARNRLGATPLHFAVGSGRVDVVKLLLRRGADPNAVNEFGTPLHYAGISGNATDELIRLLLAAGADLEKTDSKGDTPLHRAIRWNRDIERVRLLVEHGADLNARRRDGQTPYQYARRFGTTEIAEYLEARLVEKGIELFPPLPGEPKSDLIRSHPFRSEAVTILRNGGLALWSLEDEQASLRIRVQTQYPLVYDIAVSPEGAEVAVVVEGPHIERRRWDDLELIDTLKYPGKSPDGYRESIRPHSINYSPDGRWLAVAGNDERVHLLDRATGKRLSGASAGEVNHALRFAPSGEKLACACSFQAGSFVKLHRISPEGKVRPGKYLAAVDEDCTIFGAISFSPSGRWLALFQSDCQRSSALGDGWRGNLVLYDVARRAPKWLYRVDARTTNDRRSLSQIESASGFVTEPVFWTDAEIICGASNGTLFRIDVETGERSGNLPLESRAAVVSLAIDNCRERLWAVLSTGEIVPVDARG